MAMNPNVLKPPPEQIIIWVKSILMRLHSLGRDLWLRPCTLSPDWSERRPPPGPQRRSQPMTRPRPWGSWPPETESHFRLTSFYFLKLTRRVQFFSQVVLHYHLLQFRRLGINHSRNSLWSLITHPEFHAENILTNKNSYYCLETSSPGDEGISDVLSRTWFCARWKGCRRRVFVNWGSFWRSLLKCWTILKVFSRLGLLPGKDSRPGP